MNLCAEWKHLPDSVTNLYITKLLNKIWRNGNLFANLLYLFRSFVVGKADFGKSKQISGQDLRTCTPAQDTEQEQKEQSRKGLGREELAGIFRRIRQRSKVQKLRNYAPYTPCSKCGVLAWEHDYDTTDWYCFRCGNRGYWRGVGAERQFVQGGSHA